MLATADSPDPRWEARTAVAAIPSQPTRSVAVGTTDEAIDLQGRDDKLRVQLSTDPQTPCTPSVTGRPIVTLVGDLVAFGRDSLMLTVSEFSLAGRRAQKKAAGKGIGRRRYGGWLGRKT